MASLVFACTCGKRLYGKKVEEEYLRQKKVYEQDAETRARQQVERAKIEKRQAEDSQTMTDALAYRARFEAKRKAKEEDELSRSSQKELEEWRAKAADVTVEDAGKPATEEQSEQCTWHQCDKGPSGGPAPRRKGSKYCSRDCSNKNARWRHKKRKSSPKSA